MNNNIRKLELIDMWTNLNKTHDGNLFVIADQMINTYMRNDYRGNECDYIKHLKALELFIPVLKHIGSVKRRYTNFDFRKCLLHVEPKLNEIRKRLYDSWKLKKFPLIQGKLMFEYIISGKLSDAGKYKLELVSRFIPYNKTDAVKLKRMLGMKG